MSKKTTIYVSGTRSYEKLTRSVIEVNSNLYGDSASFTDDHIKIKDVYDKEYNLTHYELTGTALDFFQVGIRYGRLEEQRPLQERINYLLETN